MIATPATASTGGIATSSSVNSVLNPLRLDVSMYSVSYGLLATKLKGKINSMKTLKTDI